jgi:hypothetical protein
VLLTTVKASADPLKNIFHCLFPKKEEEERLDIPFGTLISDSISHFPASFVWKRKKSHRGEEEGGVGVLRQPRQQRRQQRRRQRPRLT